MLVHHADAERNGIERRADLPHLVVDEDLAAVGAVEAVRDAHGGGLARAVFADDGVDGAGGDDDVEMVVGENGAEALGNVAQLESHCAIASVTLICPEMIFFLASSASRIASGETRSRLY